MIQDRRVAVIFRFISFLIALAGLLLHMNIFIGEFFHWRLMYYTIQSNILALFMFGLLLIKTIIGYAREGKYGKTGFFARFEMVCVVDLLLTLIVYWALLAPGVSGLGDEFKILSFHNFSVHLITPLLCLIDYILFTESGHLKYKDVYAITIFPLLYVLYTSIAGLTGYVYRISADGRPVRFPYFFFDFDEIGLKAFLYIGVLMAIFLLFAHVFYWLDKKLKKPLLYPKGIA